MLFTEFKLSRVLQEAIDKFGYQNCTEIQQSAIPIVLDGKDLAGLAQTGTGKTAAFLLPLMERVLVSMPNAESTSTPEESDLQKKRAFPEWRTRQFVLILVPTRELADQVLDNFEKLKGSSSLQGVAIYGGVGYDKQIEKLTQGVEFVIATPGRLIDLYKEHKVDLRQVRAIVFDEADRMFDMGFKDDMKYILQRVPKERQFLVFSATLNFEVLNTAYQFGAEPVEVNISKDATKAENVKDQIFHVGNEDKPAHLLSLLHKHKPRQAIVFSNFKNNVERIAEFLNRNALPAMGISSLLSQAQRNRVIEKFKGTNDSNILVATDVAARGLDVQGVDLVINYELPDDAENYVHRIGRTGRAGENGLAFSLAGENDVDAVARIESYLGQKIETGWLEDQDLIKGFKPMPHREYVGAKGKTGAPKTREGQSSGPRHERRPNERRPMPERGPRERQGQSEKSAHRPRPPHVSPQGRGQQQAPKSVETSSPHSPAVKSQKRHPSHFNKHAKPTQVQKKSGAWDSLVKMLTSWFGGKKGKANEVLKALPEESVSAKQHSGGHKKYNRRHRSNKFKNKKREQAPKSE